MTEIIYPNRDAAEKACRVYLAALKDLKEFHGIRTECDYGCSFSFAYAKFYDEDGDVLELKLEFSH